MKNSKAKKMEISQGTRYFRWVGIASLCGVGVMAGLFVLLSWMMTKVDFPQKMMDPLVIIVAAVGSFCAGYICSRAQPGKGIFLGLACGGVLFLLSMLAGMCVLPGGFGPIALIKLFAMLLCAALGGSFGVNKRARHR